MARITVEDCLKKGYNKFMLVHLAAKRVFQMRKGKEPLVTCDNREIVPAPTDDQVEPETAVEADEEMGAEAAAEAGEQGEPEPTVEAGVEMNTEAQEEGEPKAESETDKGEEKDESTSEKA
jgi:DNA-directed RNA polymerase omega subunit